MRIHKIEGGYVVGMHGDWLPGVYETEEAAREAEAMPREELVKLRDRANARAVPISMDELNETRTQIARRT